MSEPNSGLNMSSRIRWTPYADKVEEAGGCGFSVVNHTLLPKGFGAPVEGEYWHLCEHARVWDVSCQRQVEISGPDAEQLVQWMTPRDVSNAKIGQCFYVPLADERARMLNDPVLLKLANDRFWLSIADSDVLLWAKGLALGARMDVHVHEPDVSPLAVQGPKAEDVVATLFGDAIRKIKFFRFGYVEFQGTTQLIARSGFSKQGGFEIYLNLSALGPALWDSVMEAGQAFIIRAGCPNLIERIEGGLLSFGNEMNSDNNPLECGMADYCDLDAGGAFIGQDAIEEIRIAGHQREIRGVTFGGAPCPQCVVPWPVHAAADDQPWIGQVTSGIYSPKLNANIGLSMIERGYWEPGQAVFVETSDGQVREGQISSLPFA
ncbi:MAG: dimethylsulfoniopropionate demethylase [Alphaproteobacteria bacterium]|nr:dimethylsulfoniopropionate demethylase [Alphaproteobacteria bacterium]